MFRFWCRRQILLHKMKKTKLNCTAVNKMITRRKSAPLFHRVQPKCRHIFEPLEWGVVLTTAVSVQNISWGGVKKSNPRQSALNLFLVISRPNSNTSGFVLGARVLLWRCVRVRTPTENRVSKERFCKLGAGTTCCGGQEPIYYSRSRMR